MTVSYTGKVATSGFACFLRLLIRWRGSVYKLMWKEFLIFAGMYFTLNVVYRLALKGQQKKTFEDVSEYCETYGNLIPVAFMLGFYVVIAFNRWWDQFLHVPWPSRMSMFVTAHVQGQDERGRLMRRTIMRYLNLSFVITMASISPCVKRRFPTWTHMTEAGFMNEEEQKIIDGIQTPYNKYFVPLAWCTSLLKRARKEGRIMDDNAVVTLVDELNNFRGKLGHLFNYDWINIPLVYTQTVTLSVYTFFLSCLMGRQYLDNQKTIDLYIPFFTFAQFLVYMGWLKVAETLVNPMGEDDDDFELNKLIDKNFKSSYLVVDEMHAEHPQLIKDQYWDTVEFDLPYNAASAATKNNEFHMGSALKMSVSPRDAETASLHNSSFDRSSFMHRRSIFKRSSKRQSRSPSINIQRQTSTVTCTSLPENSPPANGKYISEGNIRDKNTGAKIIIETTPPTPEHASGSPKAKHDTDNNSPQKHRALEPNNVSSLSDESPSITTSSPKVPRAESEEFTGHWEEENDTYNERDSSGSGPENNDSNTIFRIDIETRPSTPEHAIGNAQRIPATEVITGTSPTKHYSLDSSHIPALSDHSPPITTSSPKTIHGEHEECGEHSETESEGFDTGESTTIDDEVEVIIQKPYHETEDTKSIIPSKQNGSYSKNARDDEYVQMVTSSTKEPHTEREVFGEHREAENEAFDDQDSMDSGPQEIPNKSIEEHNYKADQETENIKESSPPKHEVSNSNHASSFSNESPQITNSCKAVRRKHDEFRGHWEAENEAFDDRDSIRSNLEEIANISDEEQNRNPNQDTIESIVTSSDSNNVLSLGGESFQMVNSYLKEPHTEHEVFGEHSEAENEAFDHRDFYCSRLEGIANTSIEEQNHEEDQETENGIEILPPKHNASSANNALSLSDESPQMTSSSNTVRADHIEYREHWEAENEAFDDQDSRDGVQEEKANNSDKEQNRLA